MDVVCLIYFFDDDAGSESLHLKGEMHKYLVKVRRHSEGDILYVRDKKNISQLHSYTIDSIEPRSLSLKLLSSRLDEVKPSLKLHLAWCVIDSKSIEKVLASLCEIGVSKISFISCERSQKNFKLDFKRFDRIVEASMQQSGRTSIMEFDTYKNVQTFLHQYPDTKIFDFTDNVVDSSIDYERVLIGCEGGFSQTEKDFFDAKNVFRFKTNMILRSESAVVGISSKILL